MNILGVEYIMTTFSKIPGTDKYYDTGVDNISMPKIYVKKSVEDINIDCETIDNNMFETIKIEKRDKVEAPAFDMNDLHKKLKNDKDVKKNIYDYYKLKFNVVANFEYGIEIK